MNAKAILKRYAAGERDFRQANLRGQSFVGANLSQADFSEADLRSADFTRATLTGCNFRKAKAGLQSWRRGALLVASGGLAAVAGLLAGSASTFAAFAFTGNRNEAIAAWVALAILVGLLARFLRQGMNLQVLAKTVAATSKVPGWVVLVVCGAVLLACAGVAATAGIGPVLGALAGAIAGMVVGIFASLVPLVLALAFACAATLASPLAGAVALAIATAAGFGSNGALTNPLATAVTSGVLLALLLVGVYLAWRALQNDPRHRWIRVAAVRFATIGGTRFRQSNLTEADLRQTDLSHTDLRQATLDRANCHQAKSLAQACLAGTILFNAKVRQLVTTHEGTKESYVGCNLSGAYLLGAALHEADFTDADVSGAILKAADLKRANLTQTQALGTDFTDAQLTGTCLQDWRIGCTTHLHGVQCDYVYLREHYQERRPNSGFFQPGEFAQLFESALDTLDLIFRNNLDWQALATAIQQHQAKHEIAELSVQSLEDKSDGLVVVKLKVPPALDREQMHADFIHCYGEALEAVEATDRTERQATNRAITIHRQRSSNLSELVRLLATSRPSGEEPNDRMI